MAYPGELTDEQWALLAPVLNAPGKLLESFGCWTRVWSQFRRRSGTGTWARALTLRRRGCS
jgi:putative transposase